MYTSSDSQMCLTISATDKMLALKRLPRKMAVTIEPWRLERRLRRYRSPALDLAYTDILEGIDRGSLRRLQQLTKPIFDQDPFCPAKYALARRELLRSILRAANLGLHESETGPLSILDIGCGAGYFLAVARRLGHSCEGVDMPEDALTPLERTVYAEMLDLLGVSSHVSRIQIRRHEPLPYEAERFDLITAFLVCFNRHNRDDEWSADEWQFFVNDAMRCTRAGGRLHFFLNANPKRYPELLYYDVPTLAYLRSVGRVDGSRVSITK